MLAERNPYDPIEVKWPSPWYWFKAGAAAVVGASIVGGLAWFLFWVGFIGVLGGLGAMFRH